MTTGLFALANGLAYLALKYQKKDPSEKKNKLLMKFGLFSKLLDLSQQYLKKHELKYTKAIHDEQRKSGLIIKKAYLGLADHIYEIDAGVKQYKEPESPEEYENQQVIDVRK